MSPLYILCQIALILPYIVGEMESNDTEIIVNSTLADFQDVPPGILLNRDSPSLVREIEGNLQADLPKNAPFCCDLDAKALLNPRGNPQGIRTTEGGDVWRTCDELAESDATNLECPKGFKYLDIDLKRREIGAPWDLNLFNPSSGRFLKNGYFGYDKEFYSPQEYCINGLAGEFVVQLKICEPDCATSSETTASPSSSSALAFLFEKKRGTGRGRRRPCILKCCDPDEIYSFSQKKCIKSTGVWYKPIFYHDMSNKVKEQETSSSTNAGSGGNNNSSRHPFSSLPPPLPHYTVRFPRSFKYHCQENATQIFPSGSPFAQKLSHYTGLRLHSMYFRVRKDGTIIYRKGGKYSGSGGGPSSSSASSSSFLQDNTKKCYTLKTEDYCIDGATDYGRDEEYGNDDPGSMFLATCSEALYESPTIGPLSVVYGNVMILSSLFALLTVLVYSVLREKRESIHGVTVISYSISIFFMYVSLGMGHLIRYYQSNDVLKTTTCTAIGIAAHFFSLTSFFWLTVMNWDLWWTFRKIRPSGGGRRSGGKSTSVSWKKLCNDYLKYSLFGWGIPLMVIGLSCFLHFSYEKSAEEDCGPTLLNLPLPAYGRESCEIRQLSLGVYLYFPATVLFLCNILFFAFTVYSLYHHAKTTRSLLLQNETRRKRDHNQSIHLFVKLFLVMGATRVFEVVTWYESSGPDFIYQDFYAWYWAVFDMFNVLQALAIFFIYVCKKDVLLTLKEKVRLNSCTRLLLRHPCITKRESNGVRTDQANKDYV